MSLAHCVCYVSPCRSEQVEREGVLRTKVMRERDEVKMAVRHYRFVLLRIRMPDGFILQGEWNGRWVG